jgi:hypothetical protein
LLSSREQLVVNLKLDGHAHTLREASLRF